MAEPPPATLTLLFTDIEGSTRRWEQKRGAGTAEASRRPAAIMSR